MSVIGKLNIKTNDTPEAASLNVAQVSERAANLARFGMSVDESSPPSDATIDSVCNYAAMIASALGIEDKMIGYGASISQGERISASLDNETNRISILVNESLGLTSLSVLWVAISTKFGVLKDMNAAVMKMIERKIPSTEAKRHLTNKWKATEEILLSVIHGISVSCEQNMGRELTATEAMNVNKAFRHITGQDGEAIPVTSTECSMAIAKMSREITDAVGVVVTDDLMTSVYSLMSLRSEVISSIQSFNSSGNSDMYIPYKYFERMMIVSRDRAEDVSEIAPGMALAAYVSAANNIPMDTLHGDLDLLPTSLEMDEINDAIKDFCGIISGTALQGTKPSAGRRSSLN